MRIRKALATCTMVAVFTTGAALAQDHRDDHHDNSHYVRHNEWHKGAKISHDDWNRGDQVDWHAHHLRTPPRGYEWRQVDGNYVLAAAATGLIAATIVAAANH